MDNLVRPEILADLLPSVLAQGTYRGRLYSIATFDSGLGLYGNSRKLQSVGTRIPTTIDEAWTVINEIAPRMFADNLDLIQGAERIVEAMASNGLKIGLVTDISKNGLCFCYLDHENNNKENEKELLRPNISLNVEEFYLDKVPCEIVSDQDISLPVFQYGPNLHPRQPILIMI